MKRSAWMFALAGLLAALFLAAGVSPHASPAPDGLERVAADQGFLEKGEGEPFWRHAPMADYALALMGDGPAATAAAGVLGTLCAFALGCGFAAAVRARKRACSLEAGPRQGDGS